MTSKPGRKLESLSCRERVKLLCAYLDRELPAAQRRLVAAHRRSCHPCSSLLAGLERTLAALRALRRSKAPSSARRALRDALRSL